MKTTFRTLLVAGAAIILAGCANRGGNDTSAGPAAAMMANATPKVTVAMAQKKVVPQTETYSTTVEAYAVNNIVPQTGGRILKLNVEVGDFVSKVQICGGCSTAANSHDTFTGRASPEPNRDIQGNPQVMQTYNPPVSVRSSQKEKGGKHGNRNGEWRTGRGIGKRADGEDSQRQRGNTTKQEAQEFESKNRLLKGNKYLSIPA